MTNHEFRCWFNGFLSLTDDEHFNKRQLTIVENHANLVAAISGSLEDDVSAFLSGLKQAMGSAEFIPTENVIKLTQSSLAR